MKNIKEKWPVYVANTAGLLALGFFIMILSYLVTTTGTHVLTDKAGSSISYFSEEDPDSLYKQSLEELPYREYKRKTDSMKNIQLRYTLPFWSGFNGAPFGAGYCMECDTCTQPFGPYYDYYSKTSPRYYMAIPGFRMPGNGYDVWEPPLFYKKGGVSYMKYFRQDTIRQGQNKGSLMGHWVNKPIRYRVMDNITDKEKKEKSLLIPVSKTTYTVLNMVCWGTMIIYVLLFLLVLRNFILVLIDIARGKAFEVNNYRRLFFIAGAIAFSPVYSFVGQVLLQWSFRSYYAGDLAVYIDWQKYLGWLLGAAVVFLLAIAFRKGYRIQQEQELTI